MPVIVGTVSDQAMNHSFDSAIATMAIEE